SAVLGGVVGLGTLARIDFPIFAIVLAAFWILTRRQCAVIGRVTLAAAIAVIVSSPWFIYNKREFGSFMPSSGVATSARGEFRGIEEPVGVRAARALECFWWSAPFSGFGSVTLYSGSFRNAAGWAALAAVVTLIFALRHHRRREDVLLFAA